MSKNNRLNISLSPELIEFVRETAKEEGITMNETLRRNIIVSKYIRNRKKKGQRIYIEEGNSGKYREVEFVI